MRHLVITGILCLFFIPLFTHAQLSTEPNTIPTIINTGIDTNYNMVYAIFDRPITTTQPGSIDGFTLIINGIPRALVNRGATRASKLQTEVYLRPANYTIKPTDTITLSYTPGGVRITDKQGVPAVVYPATKVTNGTNRDTTCPTLYSTILARSTKHQAVVVYASEHLAPGLSWRIFSSDTGTMMINGIPVESYKSASLGSNIAIAISEPKLSSWNGSLSITSDETTNIQDLSGNKLCPDTYIIGPEPDLTIFEEYYNAQYPDIPDTADEPEPTENDETAEPDQPNETPQNQPQNPTNPPAPPENPAPEYPKPLIISLSNIEPAGSYPIGSTLTMTMTTDQPVDQDSYAIITLNQANIRVYLRPVSDGATTLTGSYFVTDPTEQGFAPNAVYATAGEMQLLHNNDTSVIADGTENPTFWQGRANGNFSDKEFYFTNKKQE